MSTIQAPDLSSNVAVEVPAIPVEMAKQIDLAPKSKLAPHYKFRRLTQVQGGTSMTLQSSSTTQSIFLIPGSKVINYSKSYITLDWIVAAGSNLNNMFIDSIPIDSITLQTDSGQIIGNLQNAQQYTKVSQCLSTPMKEYLSRGSVYGDTANGASGGTSYPTAPSWGCQPAKPTTAYKADWVYTASSTFPGLIFQGPPAQSQLVANFPSPVYIGQASNAQTGIISVSGTASQASGVDDFFTSPQHLVTSASGAALFVRWRIPLKAFLGTVLAMDKDLFFGQNMQLIINWQQANRWGFNCTVSGGTIAGLSVANNVTNYYLFVCEEINEDIVATIKAEVASGLRILVPYTNCDSLSVTGGTSSSFTKTTVLTPGMGVALKRCLTIPINSTNNLLTSVNNDNVNATKFQQLQSSLDSSPIQDYILDMKYDDMWNYLFTFIKNVPAGISARNYYTNMFWLDNFADADASEYLADNDCHDSGLIPKNPMNYSIQFYQNATSGPNLQLCGYQTWARYLVIRPDGISWQL